VSTLHTIDAQSGATRLSSVCNELKQPGKIGPHYVFFASLTAWTAGLVVQNQRQEWHAGCFREKTRAHCEEQMATSPVDDDRHYLSVTKLLGIGFANSLDLRGKDSGAQIVE
jgi:hypothetical protein